MKSDQNPGGSPRELTLTAYTWFVTIGVVLFYSFLGSGVMALAAESVSVSGEIDIGSRNLFLAVAVTQILFLLTPTVILARRHPLGLVESLRLRPVPPIWWLLVTLAIIAVIPMTWLWGTVQEIHLVPDGMADWYLEQRSAIARTLEPLYVDGSLSLLLLGLFAIAILTGAIEELFFRGLVQRGFEQERPAWTAITLAAMIFAAIHAQPTNLIGLFGVGLLLGFIAWRSNSILPAIYGHILFNGLQFGLLNSGPLPMSLDDPMAAATPETLTAILPIGLVGGVVLGVVVVVMRRVGRG